MNAQDCQDLRVVIDRTGVFIKVNIKVVKNVAVLTKECTARPCFHVSLRVSVPTNGGADERHVYVASVNENLLININHLNNRRNRKKFDTKSSADIERKICF